MPAIATSGKKMPSLAEVRAWFDNLCKACGVGNFSSEAKDWFIANQYDEWVASKRPYTSKELLVYGVKNLSRFRMRELARSVRAYHYITTGDDRYCRNSPCQTHRDTPPVPEYIVAAVRVTYPGIPRQFINISIAYLQDATGFSLGRFIPVYRKSLITFILIATNAGLPTEMIRQILLHLGVDIYKTDGRSYKFIEDGLDLREIMNIASQSGIEESKYDAINSLDSCIDGFWNRRNYLH